MKKIIKYLASIFLILVIAFISIILYMSRDDINANFDNIESKISALQIDERNAGFAVSVFTKDSVLFQKGFGYADLKNQVPYTAGTCQYIASISKTTIGIALMKLQEMGMLSLDDSVNAHLPFELSNPRHPDAEITIRHLATHTSSLTYNEKVVESLYINDSLKQTSLEGFVTAYFLNGSYGDVLYSENVPGSTFDYSNIASGLAAYIVERESRMSFADFTRKNIFDVLQMENTGWHQNDSLKEENIISYYEPIDDKLKEVKADGVILYPARDLHTNVIDLTKYYQAVMSSSEKLLTTKSFEELLAPQLTKNVSLRTVDNTGAFWMIDRNNYGVYYKLTGMNGGDSYINTMAWFDPKSEIGYIFLGNTGGSEANRYNHIKISQCLASFSDYHLLNSKSNSFLERLSHKWYNLYSRINAVL